MSIEDTALEARLCALDAAACYTFSAFDVLDSTNAYLKALSSQGAPEWSAVIAAEQTAGRGRLGRSFFSPGATGLYMSVLLKPSESKYKLEAPTFITVAAAVAAARAIERLSGRETRIKWVNDIYIDEKKVSGILAEGVFGSTLESVVLGIGVNLYKPQNGFPDDISNKAAYIFEDVCEPDKRAELAIAFLNEFYTLYAHLGERGYMNEYREREYLTGRQVEFERNGKKQSGIVSGVGDDAELIVALDDGGELCLRAGEVSVKIQK